MESRGEKEGQYRWVVVVLENFYFVIYTMVVLVYGFLFIC